MGSRQPPLAITRKAAPGSPLSALSIRLALAFVVLISVLAAASTWRVYGHTWDEPEHLAAGIELLDRGRYEYDTEHPPIGRIMMALGPYLAGARSYGTPPPVGVQEGLDILYNTGHYDLFLTLARLGMVPFLVLLMLTMWHWATRTVVSEQEALLGVVLLATVPPILGHAALAALDVAAAATILLALYTAVRWLISGKWQDAIFFGLATGLAVGTKFSAIPFVGLGLPVLAVARWALALDARRDLTPVVQLPRWGWKSVLGGPVLAATVATIPIILAYAAYTGDSAMVARRFNWAVAFMFRPDGWRYNYATAPPAHLWLPRSFKLLFEGIVALKAHNDAGHVSFLLGQVKANGWWYFYLVALAVKTPLTLLATGPVGLAVMARDGWRTHDLWRLAPLLLFLTLLIFSSAFSRINIGIRHVLILYPFLALGASYALLRMWRAAQTSRNWNTSFAGRVLVVVLIGWQVSTLWTAYPDYLPYFNETVSNPGHVLVDSDLDWGQDLRRLESALKELKVPRLSLAYQGTADLAREPLPPMTRLVPGQPAKGWIAISALAREHYMHGYAWLDAYRPIERIGKTIDLYYVP